MKVLILSNDDLSSSIIFSPLLSEPRIQIVGIGISSTVAGGKGWWRGSVQLLLRMSWRYWGFLVASNLSYRIRTCLRSLGIGRHDRDVPCIRVLARELGIPIFFEPNFNTPTFLDFVDKSGVEVIVIRVNQILKSPLIRIPPKGVYCVHSSLLPAYRGIAGEFHALWNGDTEIGSSLFRVVEKLDAGPVVRQFKFPVDRNRSVFSHILENNRRASDLLRACLLELNECGSLEQRPLSQNPPTSYFSWPTSDRVRQFKRSGGYLIGVREIWATLFADGGA